MTIGAYALSQESMAKWLVFDADTDGLWQQLGTVASDLAAQGITSYREQSCRGGHLWIFLAAHPGVEVRLFGKELLGHYGLSEKRGTEDGIELYPKQDTVESTPNKLGSLVRLPLGIHQMTGRRYHFVTLEGTPLAPTIRAQMELLSHPQRVPEAFFTQVKRQPGCVRLRFPHLQNE